MQDKRKLEGEIFKENCLTKYDGRTEPDSALSSTVQRRFRTPRKTEESKSTQCMENSIANDDVQMEQQHSAPAHPASQTFRGDIGNTTHRAESREEY